MNRIIDLNSKLLIRRLKLIYPRPNFFSDRDYKQNNLLSYESKYILNVSHYFDLLSQIYAVFKNLFSHLSSTNRISHLKNCSFLRKLGDLQFFTWLFYLVIFKAYIQATVLEEWKFSFYYFI